MASDYLIRPLTAEDETVLWETLAQGLQTETGEAPPREEIAQRPELARYVQAWGRASDRGFVAHDTENQQVLGAVWFRAPSAGTTPELAFAVGAGHRKRGIGAALLTQWVRSNPDQSEISLHVRANHPAVRLYERFGFQVVGENGGSVILRREV